MAEESVQVLERGEAARMMNTYRDHYSPEVVAIIRSNKCPGATDAEFDGLMTYAYMRGLNPMTGQIHFVKRKSWDSETNTSVERWVPQVGIDGFRVQAARTGLYDGQSKPVFVFGPDGNIESCEVEAYRKGSAHSFPGVVAYDEYVQTYYDKKAQKKVPNTMWATKPRVMLGKCAEAQALRKAFPEELGGMYIPEEIEDEREEREDRGAVVSRQVAQVAAAPEQRALPAAKDATEWTALINEAASKGTAALDKISDELRGIPKGPLRAAMSATYQKVYGEVLAEEAKPAKAPALPASEKACEVCNLVGAHAADCVDGPGDGIEPPPPVESV